MSCSPSRAGNATPKLSAVDFVEAANRVDMGAEPIAADADARLAALGPVSDVVLGRFAALVAGRR